MSIMVEYDLPKWCEGCNKLSTEKQYVGDIVLPYYLTCEHLNFCSALRTHWKLDEQPATNCDKTQWISVKDKLSDNDERIIVIDEYSDIHRAKFENGRWRELYTWFDIPNVELWMPEPELPDEQPKREERNR